MLVAVNNSAICLYGELYPPINLPEALAQIEASIIERTVAACGGSQNKAAQVLKLKRTTLQWRRKRYQKKEWVSKHWAKEISYKPEELPDGGSETSRIKLEI